MKEMENNMAEVPINPQDLDEVIYQVATDFIEDKAINGVIEEIDPKLIKEVVNDIVFVINSYMLHFNEKINAVQLATQAETFKTNFS